jgi:uncharacterized protein (TIGR00369 family)
MTDTPRPGSPAGNAATSPRDARPTSPATSPTTVAEWRAAAAGTLFERMEIEVDHVAADLVSGHMPVAGNTQPAGLLHGGASVVLAESLGSIAAQLHAGPGRDAVGIEVNATHHRGVRAGVVHGEARALHLGRTTAVYEIVVTDDDGRRVCTARLTCMILQRA